MSRRAAFLFCLLCAAWYIHETVWNVIPSLGHPSDFTQSYLAAQNVLAGRSPFVTQGYIYPPLLATLLAPLGALSYIGARWMWFLISQACLLAAAWLMWKRMGKDRAAACSIAVVWAFGGAAVESLALGQPGPPLVLLLAIAYTQRGWRPAVAAGFGLALKFIPGVLAFALLLRRDWRGLAIFTGVALAFLALPWTFTICCLDGPKIQAGTDTWTGTPATLSWSLPSVVLRILDSPTPGAASVPRDWEFGNDLPNLRLPAARRWISLGVSLAILLAGLVVLTVSLRTAGLRPASDSFGHWLSPAQVPFAMAALTSLSLAAAPVSWTHYQILQYPGVALLLCYALQNRRWITLGSTLACAALLYPMPVAILSAYYEKYGKWTAASPATLYLWTSVPPLAALVLFGLLVRAAVQIPPDPYKT
jgi:Glycosyltransferase family 87